MFPKFTGHGPCPKCGGTLRTYWHEAGFSDWETPLSRPPLPCHEIQGWPRAEGGALDLDDEEHLHRVCTVCGYQAIEALASPGQRVAPLRYEQAYGLKAINEKAAQGWQVVAAFMPGADVVAVMRR